MSDDGGEAALQRLLVDPDLVLLLRSKLVEFGVPASDATRFIRILGSSSRGTRDALRRACCEHRPLLAQMSRFVGEEALIRGVFELEVRAF